MSTQTLDGDRKQHPVCREVKTGMLRQAGIGRASPHPSLLFPAQTFSVNTIGFIRA